MIFPNLQLQEKPNSVIKKSLNRS